MLESLFWLTINIYHEARGEPFEGMVAVGHVTLNRVLKENKSVKDVVKRHYQFSWYDVKNEPAINDNSSFIKCMKAAAKVTEERLEGKSMQDADHYFADYIPVPDWAVKMKFINKIGHHLFYKS